MFRLAHCGFIHSSKFPIPISGLPSLFMGGRISLASRFGVSICGALRDPRHVWAGALLIENGEMLQISNFFLESTIFATRMCLYTSRYHLTRAHVVFFCFPELFKAKFLHSHHKLNMEHAQRKKIRNKKVIIFPPFTLTNMQRVPNVV